MARRSGAGRIFFIIFMVILLPVIILTVAFFVQLNDYNMYEDEARRLERESHDLETETLDLEQFIQMPTGEVVGIFSEFGGESRYALKEVNTETGEYLNAYPMPNSLYSEFFVAYQNDGIIYSYLSENYSLELYSYKVGSEPVKLQYEPISIENSAYSRSRVFDNGMYFVGQNDNNEYIALTVIDGNVSTTNLSQMPELQGLNITRMWNYDFMTYDINYPVVEISTYENDEYFYDMYLATNTIDNYDNAAFWDTEDGIISKFTDVESMLVDAEDSPHTANLFYPELFYLNTNEVLTLGRVNVNDDSPVSGIITDITGQNLIRTLPQSDLLNTYRDTSSNNVQIQELNQSIYLTHEKAAGVINGNVNSYTFDEYEEQILTRAEEMRDEFVRLLEEGEEFSWEKALHFAQNDVAGQVPIINIAAFIGFPIVAILVIAIVSRFRRNKGQNAIKDAYANGGEVVVATLLSMRQTGMYVNEQPQVDAVLSFWFRGRELTKNYRTFVDLVQPPRAGEQFQLLYDPVKDKLLDPNP